MTSIIQRASETLCFIKAQTNAMEKSKYIESEKAHRDLYFDISGEPSNAFYIWWIDNHAKNFRNAWPKSLCKRCYKIMICKDCLKNECPNFDPEK